MLPSSFCHWTRYLKELYIYIYIYIYIYTRSTKRRNRTFIFISSAVWDILELVYFRPLMSLRACSNHFLMLCNHMGMVVPHVFHSCWRLFTLDQIQLDKYCTVVWRWYEATFKLRPLIPIFERNKMNECPRKPWQPTSIGITWHSQPFSMQSACNVLYQFFFCLCGSSRFSSQGTVNSMSTIFFESDHTTMSGCFSVWIMWTGNCRDVFRSAESFQSRAPFASFILEFFLFPHRALTFLVKLNYGFLGCNKLLVCCLALCF